MAKNGGLPYGAMQKAATRMAGNTMMHRLQRGGGEIGPMNPHVMPFTKMKNAALHAAKMGQLKKVPGKANVPGDSTQNDKVPILASPGEGVVPRSIMKGLPHMAEGGEVPDPMKELLEGPETTDEYAKQRMAESKKYKNAKPGDPGVRTIGFDDDGKETPPVKKMADGGEVPPPSPGFWAAMRNWMANQGEPQSNAVAEEANKQLPRFLSGRDAVEKKRAQLKKIDADTKE